MPLLAGTSRGVFRISGGRGEQVLASRGVRDLVRIGDCIFAGTGAGLYRSDDDGASWRPPALENHEIWQIRAGENELLVGTQPAGLFRSRDMGEHFERIESFNQAPEAAEWCVPVEPPLPGRARALVVDPHEPQRLWVGVEVGGIMHSHDGGASWSLVLPGENPDIHMLFAHPAKPDVLFVSTGYGRLDGIAEMKEGNAGVFRSEDGGSTWEYAWHGITPRYSRPMCIDTRPPYALTVASAPTAFSSYKDEGGAGAMLFRSEDEGRSWDTLCDPAHTPSAANFHGLTVDPDNPGGVLVGTDTGELWRVGRDANWRRLAQGIPAVLSIAAWS